MIQVHCTRDARGNITAFSAEGHSNYAAYGEDIVCAAISTLLQGAQFSLQVLFPGAIVQTSPTRKLPLELTISSSTITGIINQEIQLILKHTLLGLMNIAIAYPHNIALSISDLPKWQDLFSSQEDAATLLRLTLFPL